MGWRDWNTYSVGKKLLYILYDKPKSLVLIILFLAWLELRLIPNK